jgi:hypothetical protein
VSGQSEPDDGLAWDYRIPILNNRYVWARWGWAALAFGAGFALVLGTPLVVAFAGGNGGCIFAVKVYAAIALIAGMGVVGLGMFAAVAVANGLTARFTLNAERAVAVASEGVSDSVEGAASMLGGSSRQVQNLTAAAALLLPQSGEAKWRDVRRAVFDERRHVITLRRRWPGSLRVYAPPERFTEAAAFVRAHLPTSARGG